MGGLMSVTGERDDLGGGPQKVGWLWRTSSPACMPPWPSWPRCVTPNGPGGGQSTWRCWTQVAMLAGQSGRQLPRQRQQPGRAGNAHQTSVPYQVFEVAPRAGGSKDPLHPLRWATTASLPSFAPWLAGHLVGPRSRGTPNQDGCAIAPSWCRSSKTLMKPRKTAWLPGAGGSEDAPCGAINNLAGVRRTECRSAAWSRLGASAQRRPEAGGQPDQAGAPPGAH